MIELQLPCGFDTLEYSWVKATIGIYMLVYYSMAKKRQQAFWRHCRGSQLILSFCGVNMIQLVNNISLCRIIFCSVLFVVLIEMW
jgi:ribosomal protein S6